MFEIKNVAFKQNGIYWIATLNWPRRTEPDRFLTLI